MPIISIIMPVYNSQDYVRNAIESILDQDFEDFELLVIDDGSTDESAAICDELARSDERIRVFHQANGGMCHARNNALELIRGKYVTFCDNDDEYLPGLLGNGVKAIDHWNADCLCYGRVLRTLSPDGDIISETVAVPRSETCLEGDEIYRQFRKCCYGTDGVWARIYRTSFLRDQGILFDEECRNGVEDLLFNLQVLDCARRIAFLPKVYYVWMRRLNHSASMQLSENRFNAIEMDVRRADAFMVDHGIYVMDPGVYASRMLASFESAVLRVSSLEQGSYAQEKVTYKRLRSIYRPYASRILSCPINTKSRMLFSQVMAGRYRAAYALARFGTRFLDRMRRLKD